MSHAPLATQPLDAVQAIRIPLEPQWVHVAMRVPAAVDADTLSEAVSVLAAHFPVLSHCLPADCKYWSEPTGPSKMLDVITTDSADSFDKLVDKAMTDTTDVTVSPALHVTLVQLTDKGEPVSGAVVCAVSHVATDLAGAVATASNLAKLYTSLAQGVHPTLDVTTDRSFKQIEKRVSGVDRLKMRGEFEQDYHPSRDLIAPLPHTTSSEPGVVACALPPETTRALMALAESAGVKLDAVLASSLARCVGRMVTRPSVRIPVFASLRSMADELYGPANLGSYVMAEVDIDQPAADTFSQLASGLKELPADQALAWPLQASLTAHALGLDGLSGVCYDLVADPLVSLEEGGYFSATDFDFDGKTASVSISNAARIWPHLELSSCVIQDTLRLSIAYLGDTNTHASMQAALDDVVRELNGLVTPEA